MYCDDIVCHRGMIFDTGLGVHETNYATEGFPEILGEGDEGKMPPKWEICVCWPMAIVFVPD